MSVFSDVKCEGDDIKNIEEGQRLFEDLADFIQTSHYFDYEASRAIDSLMIAHYWFKRSIKGGN